MCPAPGAPQRRGAYDWGGTYSIRASAEERWLDSLPREPAPELERLLSDAPAAREVGELAHVAVLVGEREGVLVVIEIQFHYLTLTLAHEWVVTY